ncbi:hypothetical protein STIAU_8469 [Stigmatella aurantiaca DW4/3-1]|uniref:Uncharacterized protein n=1 Tax=Stigmatella aurantiaca (strain DW4/3-1) TaxID=378806 RepID=Q08ZS5_STIAD|nr:hypothetical protein STIAU_8469 [Stigmatella aurantiaca DW4/3-1]
MESGQGQQGHRLALPRERRADGHGDQRAHIPMKENVVVAGVEGLSPEQGEAIEIRRQPRARDEHPVPALAQPLGGQPGQLRMNDGVHGPILTGRRGLQGPPLEGGPWRLPPLRGANADERGAAAHEQGRAEQAHRGHGGHATAGGGTAALRGAELQVLPVIPRVARQGGVGRRRGEGGRVHAGLRQGGRGQLGADLGLRSGRGRGRRLLLGDGDGDGGGGRGHHVRQGRGHDEPIVVERGGGGDARIPVQAELQVVLLLAELGGRHRLGQHELAVLVELDEAHLGIGGPLHAHHEVMPLLALEGGLPHHAAGASAHAQPHLLSHHIELQGGRAAAAILVPLREDLPLVHRGVALGEQGAPLIEILGVGGLPAQVQQLVAVAAGADGIVPLLHRHLERIAPLPHGVRDDLEPVRGDALAAGPLRGVAGLEVPLPEGGGRRKGGHQQGGDEQKETLQFGSFRSRCGGRTNGGKNPFPSPSPAKPQRTVPRLPRPHTRQDGEALPPSSPPWMR